jgi:hypothetical protein
MTTPTQDTMNLQLPTGLPTEGVGTTRTSNGSVVSILFDACIAESSSRDRSLSAETFVLNFEVPVATGTKGHVRVEAHGFSASFGAHSWTYAVIWVNGRKMKPINSPADASENFYGALCVDIGGQAAIRVSVTLLAQRDLLSQSSAARIVLDTLDFEVLSV